MSPNFLTRAIRFLTVLALLIWPSAADASSGNGITSPDDGATVSGLVPVVAIADSVHFQKWQLDLLPNGNAGQAAYLAHGEDRRPNPGPLITVDSTRYPDGLYTLRLRVVRRDGNYDESLRTVVIANGNRSVTASNRKNASPLAQDARNGLPRWTDAGEPILYLTFDDGPIPKRTREVLAVLARYDARATFFVVGYLARRYPQVIREQLEAGHAIANHTWGHRSLRGLEREAFERQVRNTADIVQEAAGSAWPSGAVVRYLRLPYGHLDENTAAWSAELGYEIVGWDVDPQDWKRPGADAIAGVVLRRAFPGAVVILHDGGGGSSQTVAALETILRELSAQGYRFHALADAPVIGDRGPEE